MSVIDALWAALAELPPQTTLNITITPPQGAASQMTMQAADLQAYIPGFKPVTTTAPTKAASTTPAVASAPAVPVSIGKAVYGPHMMGTLTQDQVARAATYGIVKSVDNPNALLTVHQANPNTICIYRDYGHHTMAPEAYISQHGGADAAADQWIKDMTPFLQQLPFAYFESFNESGISDPYLAFEAARTRKLAAQGYKACIINIASGQTNPSDWTRAKDAVQATIDHGGLIGVHSYALTLMAANSGYSRWNEQGQWEGDMFPTSVSKESDGNYSAWTGLRILRDAYNLVQQGQASARLVATELGLDDTGNLPAHIYYPKLNGQDVKTNGWKTCTPVWQDRGWLNGTTAEAFYKRQLDHWISLVSATPQIIGGTVFTYGDDSGKWTPYDVRSVL